MTIHREHVERIATRLAYQDTLAGEVHTEERQGLVELARSLGIESPEVVVKHAVQEGMQAAKARLSIDDPLSTVTAPKASATVLLRRKQLAKRRSGEQQHAVPVPWNMVSEHLGGGLGAGLHILVGSSGSMKTQYSLQVALTAAIQGHPVYFVALEMREEITDRLMIMAANARLYWNDLSRRTDEAALAETEGSQAIEALPFWLDIGAPYVWSYDRFAPLLDQWLPMTQRHTSPPLFVLDYAQLIGNPVDRRRDDSRTRIANGVYALQNAATSRGVAVLAVSSTARNNYFRKGDPLPWEQPAENYIGMGKEAGEVEFSAKSVTYLVRKPWENGIRPVGGSVFHAGIAKSRDGTPGWVELRENWGRFSEPSTQTEGSGPWR